MYDARERKKRTPGRGAPPPRALVGLEASEILMLASMLVFGERERTRVPRAHSAAQPLWGSVSQEVVSRDAGRETDKRGGGGERGEESPLSAVCGTMYKKELEIKKPLVPKRNRALLKVENAHLKRQ